jgi:hypothetical protein
LEQRTYHGGASWLVASATAASSTFRLSTGPESDEFGIPRALWMGEDLVTSVTDPNGSMVRCSESQLLAGGVQPGNVSSPVGS